MKQFLSHHSPKSLIWSNLLLVTFFLAMSIYLANDDYREGLPLQVRSTTSKMASYKRFDISKQEYFITGINGELWWYPRSLTQALILGTVDGSGIDIFHVGLLYIFVGIFYFMTRGSERNIVFSKKVYHGFLLIVCFISISGSLELSKTLWVSNYVHNITNGQFKLQMSYSPSIFYYAMGSMLFFLLQFPQKAIALQQEQDLTI
jgi:hypothetical protein